MSNSQNPEEESEKINDKMENQIFSILKGVGIIEDSESEIDENLDSKKGNLLEFDVLNDSKINQNTIINQQNYFRNPNKKSLSFKNDNKMMFKNKSNELFLKKKYPTQNYFSNHSFILNSKQIYINDSINYQIPQNCILLNNINNNYNFNQINYEHSNLYHLFTNNKNNINNIPLISTPLGKKMPIRTFNFKIKSNNKYSNNSFNKIQNQRYINIDNKIQNNLLINENIPKELESLLVQQNGFSYYAFHLLKGKFILLMKNQQTSRILQFYLEQTKQEIIHLIFKEIVNDLNKLILDIYANYFCLKIFYYLNNKDRLLFLYNISDNFDNLCINKISTYPIQCIIEKLNTDEEFDLVFNSIKNNLMKLCFDVYGTHVIEKILATFNYEKHIIHISNFILENFILLVNNSNGLCIVKKEIIIEYKRKNSKNYKKLKQLLIDNSLLLILNPFGNYALQMAIDNWDLEDIKDIINTFKGKGLLLSIQKYSSNVIERCIEKDEQFLTSFIYEISIDNKSFGILMKNNYGNYVIQTALKASKKNQNIQMMIINLINKNFILLNDKKLVNKWKNIIFINTRK